MLALACTNPVFGQNKVVLKRLGTPDQVYEVDSLLHIAGIQKTEKRLIENIETHNTLNEELKSYLELRKYDIDRVEKKYSREQVRRFVEKCSHQERFNKNGYAMRTLYYLEMWYFEKPVEDRWFQDRLQLYLKIIWERKQHPDNIQYMGCHEYSVLSNLLINSGNIDMATEILEYYYQKTHFQGREFTGVPWNTLYLYCNLGSCYSKLGNYPQAIQFYLQGIEQAKKISRIWVDIINSSLAQVYLYQNKQELANQLWTQCIERLDPKVTKNNIAEAWLGKCEIAVYQNNPAAVRECAAKSKDLLQQLKEDELWLKYYELQKTFAVNSNNQAGIFMAQDSINAYNRIIKQKHQHLFAGKLLVDNILRIEELNKNAREKSILFNRIIILFISILIVLFSIFFYQRYKKKVTALLDDITRLRLQLEDTIESLKRHQQQASGEQSLDKIKILTKKDWQDFLEIFVKLFPDFLPNLNKQETALTQADTRMACLIRLEKSAEEIGEILGISQNSVWQTKYRLKKKLNTNNLELDAFLLSL